MKDIGHRIIAALLALCLLAVAATALAEGAALPDGEYAPDGFSFSGGTGKVTITCPRVVVENGANGYYLAEVARDIFDWYFTREPEAAPIPENTLIP